MTNNEQVIDTDPTRGKTSNTAERSILSAALTVLGSSSSKISETGVVDTSEACDEEHQAVSLRIGSETRRASPSIPEEGTSDIVFYDQMTTTVLAQHRLGRNDTSSKQKGTTKEDAHLVTENESVTTVDMGDHKSDDDDDSRDDIYEPGWQLYALVGAATTILAIVITVPIVDKFIILLDDCEAIDGC